jgi:site-specific DNA-methyltransferase (adenine-specific)
MKPYYSEDGITIYHGDCREILPEVWFGVDTLISDPPYGMDYDTNGNRFTLGGRSLPPVHGDGKPFDPEPWSGFRWSVLWGFNHFPARLASGGCLVWLKRTEPAFGKFLSDAEVAWNKNGCGVYVYSDHKHAISCRRTHPTEKPIGLMRWSIERSGSPLESTVLDPFMGSGTTLVAAKELSRRAIGIEIEERYCEIAAKRLSQGVLQLEQPA